ncbi:ATP-binding protein [Marinobacter psychrophilus]|uniref:ATP-binding protein n=1 Tax=Marinobacter psychrophilus TaxID=330734 RepID=UPI001B717E95|nr:ATP-binding protein [Marinobacter psychrophilus]MBQ0763371.1 response regulator [Marinobacter psychrophilus]MBQ0845570.1 response regulator [Marinobacter psychrophilus]
MGRWGFANRGIRHWGIRNKVLMATLAPTLATTLLLGLFFSSSWVDQIESLLRDRGEALSRQLAAGSEYGLFTANRHLLGSLSNALLQEQDVRSISFFDSAGERLLHTGPDTNKHDISEQLQDQVAQQLPHPQSTLFITPVTLQGLMIENLLNGKAEAPSAQQTLGWVAVEMSHIRTEKETYKALLISLMLVLSGVVFSMLVSLRLSRAFTSPVYKLNKAVAELKEGKLETRVCTQAGPEFEQLESGLNAMAAALSMAQADMQQNVNQATEDLRETLETIEVQNIELDFARKEALEASRIKSEFLANMSHEIRTPLNGIIGFTELLLKGSLARQQRDHLNTIRKSSEILLTIINDILDFSKIEAGKLTFDRVPFQLRDIVEEVMVMLAPAAHDKNLDLVNLVYNDVPNNLMGDPLRLKQIITNLLNNAIKFTHTGEVVLRASLEEEDASNGSVTLRISVADTGMGLSRAQQRPLFDAFSQADASTARQYGGTGLGLAISKRLTEEMGGKIGLESALGKGSTFWFTLTSTRASQNDSDSPRNGLRGERMIYLEQQKTTGLAMEHLLRNWGVTVERVSSPGAMQERIEQAQQEQTGFAVALIGINRHLLNSNRYRSLVHSIEVDRDCRTLLLTPTMESHDTPLVANVSSHLTKPVLRAELYNELTLLVHGINANDHTADRDYGLATPQSEPDRESLNPWVLAVDDNEANLKLVLTLLQDAGVNTVGAASGFEALTKARCRQFDLVFMDLQMPGMDGVATTQKLRQLETASCQRAAIIALTAHAMSDERGRLARQGFDGYMTKPVSSRQLLDAVQQHTGLIYYDGAEDGDRANEVRDSRRALRPSSRRMTRECISIEESLRLAAGKADLAEELLSMLLEQITPTVETIEHHWRNGNRLELLECVHKLHGGARYCGVPEVRAAANQLETALKTADSDIDPLTDQLLRALKRLLNWGDNTHWQLLIRQHGSPMHF